MMTFSCQSYADIIMLDHVGVKLLELMDFGTAVPGGIVAGDLSVALQNLRRGLHACDDWSDPEDEDCDDDARVEVPLRHRALPLIALLESAIAAQVSVRWI